MQLQTRRGGRAGRPTAAGSSSKGGSKGGGAASAAFSGLEGGDYQPGTPQGEGSIDQANGIQGVEGQPATPSTITPLTVKHPILDAIFNKGQGSMAAMQGNLGIAQQQLGADSATKLQQLQNQGQLDITTKQGSNALAQESLAGQNAQALAAQQANLDKQRALHTHALTYMAKNNLPYSDKGYNEAVKQMTPIVLANMQGTAQNENLGIQNQDSFLRSPTGQAAMNSQNAAQLAQIGANNMAKTRMLVGLNEVGKSDPAPTQPMLGIGSRPGGISDIQSVARDPNNPLSVTTKNIQTPIPGTPGSFPSQLSDNPKTYAAFQAAQAATPGNNNPIASATPTLPSVSGIPSGQSSSGSPLNPILAAIYAKKYGQQQPSNLGIFNPQQMDMEDQTDQQAVDPRQQLLQSLWQNQ